MSNPVNIFIAYSRTDEKFLDELRRHLMPLTRAGRIQVWYDGEIEAGRVWEAEIKKALAGAEIIVLMVSSDSIASDYFYGKEVAAALERHESGTARVVPLIIRACQWAETPLKNLQAVPKNGFPVANWTPRDDGWFDAVEAIGRLVADIGRERQAAVDAVFEKERLGKEAEIARLAAVSERERLEIKAVADAEKKRQADEAARALREREATEQAARAREAEKTAEQERTKKEALRARQKELKREQEIAAKAAPPAKVEETSEWKINFAVGAIIVAIFGICAFLFFKTKACLSQKVNDLTKTENPGVPWPVKKDSANIESADSAGKRLVVESPKIGVTPAFKTSRQKEHHITSVSGELGSRPYKAWTEWNEYSPIKGVVIVDICVNSNGLVTYSKSNNKSSSIADMRLHNLAVEAVTHFRFFPSKVKRECGTIAFTFKPD